jgi:Zn ribbon nucleic-acid-binding protein
MDGVGQAFIVRVWREETVDQDEGVTCGTSPTFLPDATARPVRSS